MNCIIVDDEKLLRESLAQMLDKYCPECTIIGKAANTKDARLLLDNEHVDIIFCDIKMPGEDGISFLSSLPSNHYHIVFVTAHDEYALRALKLKAFDYLLKPIDKDELIQTLDELKQKLAQPNLKSLSTLTTLKDLVSELQHFSGSVPIKIGITQLNGTSLLEVNTILYLEGDGNYTNVFLTHGEKIMASKTLREFEKILPENQFFRIHKSTIVNIQEVKEIKRNLGISVVLKNGKELAVSRRNSVVLQERFKLVAKII